MSKLRSRIGGCSTIFYVLFLLAVFVYYAIPVFEQKNPKIQRVTRSASDDNQILFSEIGTIFF